MIGAITRAALASTLATTVDERLRYYWVEWAARFELERRDGALYTAMYACSPTNLPLVQRYLVDALNQQLEASSDVAMLLVHYLNRCLLTADVKVEAAWTESQHLLLEKHKGRFDDWRMRWSWYLASHSYDWDVLAKAVSDDGPRTLYACDGMLMGWTLSQVQWSLSLPEARPTAMTGSIDKLCRTLTQVARPWLTSGLWWPNFRRAEREALSQSIIHFPQRVPLRLSCLICLPFLEMRADHDIPLKLGAAPKLMSQLIDARSGRTHLAEIIKATKYADLTDEVRAFLLAWARREFDVIGPETPRSKSPAGSPR